MYEIHGAGFENRGAQLMLRTVLHRLRQDTDGRAEFCIEPEHDSSFKQAGPLGVHTLFPIVSHLRPYRYPMLMRASLLAGRVLPQAPLRRVGVVRRQDPQALIDISGYSFGDKFPAFKLKNFYHRAAAYHKRGKPVVLMPQMLGPFENTEHREWFRKLAGVATRIYAREQASFEAAAQALGDTTKLRKAPDITIFSPKFDDIDRPRPDGPYCCIVPNVKVLQKGDAVWKDAYLDHLHAAADAATRQGVGVCVVIHEGGKGDRDLAHQLAERISPSMVFEHEHAGVLKSFIGGSRFIVGSRFHAVVAAFSQGVPAIAIGWAHKYDLLAEEFDSADLLHRGSDNQEHLVDLVNELSDPVRNEQRRERIIDRKEQLRKPNDAMWQDVRGLLGVSNGAVQS